MYIKMGNQAESHTLFSLIWMLPPAREDSFHFFRIVQICDSMVAKRPGKWTPGSACRSNKMEVDRFRKHAKHVITKVPTSVTNMRQKEGHQGYFFVVFRVPIPGWSPRRPRTGPKAQKHVKMEALS